MKTPRSLNSKFLAPLGASSVNNAAAARCAHPLTETVSPFTLFILRTICCICHNTLLLYNSKKSRGKLLIPEFQSNIVLICRGKSNNSRVQGERLLKVKVMVVTLDALFPRSLSFPEQNKPLILSMKNTIIIMHMFYGGKSCHV